jgi:hypothetical protein
MAYPFHHLARLSRSSRVRCFSQQTLSRSLYREKENKRSHKREYRGQSHSKSPLILGLFLSPWMSHPERVGAGVVVTIDTVVKTLRIDTIDTRKPLQNFGLGCSSRSRGRTIYQVSPLGLVPQTNETGSTEQASETSGGRKRTGSQETAKFRPGSGKPSRHMTHHLLVRSGRNTRSFLPSTLIARSDISHV